MAGETYGVVVARFQAPELHPGHRYLLDTVQERHRRLVVVLGSARTYVPTDKNPLDFATRRAMVLRYYPNAIVTENRDCRDDHLWSMRLDAVILKALGYGDQLYARGGIEMYLAHAAKLRTEHGVVLYGSRDSFIPHYGGAFKTVELPSIDAECGSDMRLEAVTHPSNTEDFRRGAIYTATTRPPVLYQAVDAAIVDWATKRILVGRKREDGGRYRFVGGFVQTSDRSLEAAARREAMEETGGLELGQTRYVGSFLVDDWRYRVGKDRIMTALFVVDYIFGSAHGDDDMDEVTWMPLAVARDGELDLVDEHRPVGEALAAWLRTNWRD